MNNMHFPQFSAQQLQSLMKDSWKLTPATCAHKVTNGKWLPAKHLLYISSVIAPLIRAGNARIIVQMPARHGKSELISVNTPIWHLENWPEKNVINVSYGLELATDFSYKVRGVFTDEDKQEYLTTRLDPKKQKVDRFLTTVGGGMVAVGIGGALTGRGGHLIVVDDYIKNAEQSLSEGQRNATWDWFKSTLYTRLEPGGSLCVVATRWHQDDLIGRCIAEMPDENWVIIDLPAFALVNDLLGRKPGDPLWPERYNTEALHLIRKALGTYWWEAMYQGRPKASMSGQDIGDKLVVVDKERVPHYTQKRSWRLWDFAASEHTGDWSVGMLMSQGYDDDTIYIEEIIRQQVSSRNLEILVANTAAKDGPGVSIMQEQEPGSAGKAVYEHYRDFVLSGYSHSAEKPTGKIDVRAGPFLAAIESGHVVCVDGPWVEDFKKELNAFPDGDHDDQLTTGSLGFKQLEQLKSHSPVFGRNAIMRMRKAHTNLHSGMVHTPSGAVFGKRFRR